jgi:hypothetical protein
MGAIIRAFVARMAVAALGRQVEQLFASVGVEE